MNIIPKTIRSQIAAAFSVCFIFMAIIIVLNYSNFRKISSSMQFFEIAEEINNSLLEMRRYEKNYFLYRHDFNYEENLTYTNKLILSLQREKNNLSDAIGEVNYQNFLANIKKYSALMIKLHQANCEANGCRKLQEDIRGIGQNLLVLADEVVTTERRAINELLKQMIPLPLLSLLFLFFLLVFIILYIGEKVTRPLARITRESKAVADGAFQQITPYGDDKNEIRLLVTAINSMMAELEKRQEQLIQSRKIASIGTLTAGIAHEINNPINNLSLTLESLIEDGEDISPEERQQLREEALDQTDRISEIVKNLLEFSRASHPKIESIDLEQLVDKTTRLLNNEMSLKNITFIKEVEEDVPRVQLDKGGIQQVLVNLFLNSIQSMETGGSLHVKIKASLLPEEVRIDVIDNGVGIPKKYIDQIFDPFFTMKKEGEGTGLGLSVSYTIIKKNGGRMEVNSQPGEGSCFSIFLPINNSGA